VNPGAAHGCGDAGGEVAVGDQLDARSRLADLGDEVLMAVAVEHHDGQLVDVALEGVGDLVEVLLDGGIEIDMLAGGRSDHDLVHVDVGGVEQAALFRGGQNGDGAGGAGGAEVGPLQRIDGDVDLRIDLPLGPTAAQRLADVEHRGLVALPLADDHGAAHLEAVELRAHRLHRDLIGVLPFAVTHRARSGDGRHFGHTKKADFETGFHAGRTLADVFAEG
jgi:hypothetical protein